MGWSADKKENPLTGQAVMDDLQQVVVHLEESLRVLEEQEKDEVFCQPELIEKINQVGQSLLKVTRCMRELERSSASIVEIEIPELQSLFLGYGESKKEPASHEAHSAEWCHGSEKSGAA